MPLRRAECARRWFARSRAGCAGSSAWSGWRADGVTTFVEVGPGTRAVAGLVKKIAKGARVLNVEDPVSLDRTLSALAAEGA